MKTFITKVLLSRVTLTVAAGIGSFVYSTNYDVYKSFCDQATM